MDYEDFLDALGRKESTDDYAAVNDGGHLGRYQMCEAALEDAGYVKYDDQQDGVFEYGWTGKNGIHSKKDFLNNPEAQDDAVRAYHQKLNGYIHHFGLDSSVGKTIKGVEITPGGLLAGAHLVGMNGLIKYIRSNGRSDVPDDNGTRVSEYIKKFAGPGGPHEAKLYAESERPESHKGFESKEVSGVSNISIRN